MDDSDGASIPKRGRPSVYGGKTTRIRLTIEIFTEWTMKKEQMGFLNKTLSEFSEFLLQLCEERLIERPVLATRIDSPERQYTETLILGLVENPKSSFFNTSTTTCANTDTCRVLTNC